jgi:hypothetical protein
MMTDPIADMLTRLRNANTAFHDEVLMPSSKLKEALARILEREGYIAGWDVSKDAAKPGQHGWLRGGVARTEVGFGIENAGGALAALGGAVLAAFVGESWVRRGGLHGVLFHCENLT